MLTHCRVIDGATLRAELAGMATSEITEALANMGWSTEVRMGHMGAHGAYGTHVAHGAQGLHGAHGCTLTEVWDPAVNSVQSKWARVVACRLNQPLHSPLPLDI